MRGWWWDRVRWTGLARRFVEVEVKVMRAGRDLGASGWGSGRRLFR